jgi:alkaline phosphatase D
MPDLGKQIADANDEIIWHDPFSHGYTLVTLTPDAASASYRTVSTIYAPSYATETKARFQALVSGRKVTSLVEV